MLVTCQMRVGQKEACSPLLLQKVMGLRHALGVKCARFGVELLAAPRALFASQSECRRLKGPCPLYLQSRGPLPATEAVAPTSKEQQHRRLLSCHSLLLLWLCFLTLLKVEVQGTVGTTLQGSWVGM